MPSPDRLLPVGSVSTRRMLPGLPITLYHELRNSVRHCLAFVSGMRRGAIVFPSIVKGYSLVQSH